MSLIWMLLAPILVPMIGGAVSLRFSRRRWIVHLSVFVIMLLAPLANIYLQGVIDPITIQYPGPGDGFVLLAYVPEMILSAVVYSIFALASRVGGPDQ